MSFEKWSCLLQDRPMKSSHCAKTTTSLSKFRPQHGHITQVICDIQTGLEHVGDFEGQKFDASE